MAGFEENDLYEAFGLEQPAGENDPAPAEPGQAAQTQTTEAFANSLKTALTFVSGASRNPTTASRSPFSNRW